MRDQLRRLHALAGSPTKDRLKDHADGCGHSVSRAALAAATTDSDSAPRWATVEAFIDACNSYAKARSRPLPAGEVNMLAWKAMYDRAYPGQQVGRQSNLIVEKTAILELPDYDARRDGLFALGVWSPARRLEPSRLVTETVPADARPSQPYIDHNALSAAVHARMLKASGATVYLTGFRIDHRESDETQYCQVHQAPSTYPEVLAIEDLRIQRPDLLERCDREIEENVSSYLRRAVPSSLAVNLVIVSSDNDELLCVERSAATDSAVGWWTIGVFETMKQSDQNRPGAAEDLFNLATRGLKEELHLQPDDYNSIHISWIGLYRPILRGHVVAILKLKISKSELRDRARIAHSGYEHASIDWLPLRPALVQAFSQAERSKHPDKAWSSFEFGHRTWIDQSRLAVMEAWRFRAAFAT
jgi:hypothetical protein